MKEKYNKRRIIIITATLGLFLLIFGIAYAFFTVTLNGTKKVKITTGTLTLRLLDENNNYIDDLNPNADTGYSIELNNTVPITREDALKRNDNIYIFKVKNEGNIKAKYTISLEDLELDEGETRLEDQYIGYELKREEDEIYFGPNLSNLTNRTLDFGLIDPDEVKTYTLRLWVDNNATNEAMDKTFYAHIKLDGVQTKLEKELSLVVTNVNAVPEGNPTYTTPTIPEVQPTTFENGEATIVLPNLLTTLNNVGDGVTYTIEVENQGLYNVEYDATNSNHFIYKRCIKEGSNLSDKCLMWDLTGDGRINVTDTSWVKSSFSITDIDTIETIAPSEKKTLTLAVKYKDDARTQPNTSYKFYGDEFKLTYRRSY